jgi:hypothetical protein
MSHTARSFAPLLAIAVQACASSSMRRMGAAADAKAPNCKFDVYMSEQEVKRPVETLCMLESTSGRTLFHDRTVSGAIETLRPDACKCGVDAIVLTSANTSGWNGLTYGEGSVIAKGVRYVSSESSVSAQPATETATPASSSGSSKAGSQVPAEQAAPATGTERGPCYGNNTCNNGLTCASAICVRLPSH